MIEQYFVAGLDYNWVPPSSISMPQDGTIFPSVQMATALTYVGMAGDVLYGGLQTPASLGLIPHFNIAHTWLTYALGRTAYVQPGAADILTGFMSGCWICSWSEAGTGRVGHIGTIETAPPNGPPNTTVKNTFRNAINGLGAGANLTGYSPASHWTREEVNKILKRVANRGGFDPKILSLVTTNHDFYSILMVRRPIVPPANTSTLWVCGGKKLIAATQQAGVLQALQ